MTRTNFVLSLSLVSAKSAARGKGRDADGDQRPEMRVQKGEANESAEIGNDFTGYNQHPSREIKRKWARVKHMRILYQQNLG